MATELHYHAEFFNCDLGDTPDECNSLHPCATVAMYGERGVLACEWPVHIWLSRGDYWVFVFCAPDRVLGHPLHCTFLFNNVKYTATKYTFRSCNSATGFYLLLAGMWEDNIHNSLLDSIL